MSIEIQGVKNLETIKVLFNDLVFKNFHSLKTSADPKDIDHEIGEIKGIIEKMKAENPSIEVDLDEDALKGVKDLSQIKDGDISLLDYLKGKLEPEIEAEPEAEPEPIDPAA